jgi:hypothetical protein
LPAERSTFVSPTFGASLTSSSIKHLDPSASTNAISMDHRERLAADGAALAGHSCG